MSLTEEISSEVLLFPKEPLIIILILFILILFNYLSFRCRFFQPCQQYSKKRDKLRNEIPGAEPGIFKNFNVQRLFIFNAGREQRHGAAVFKFYKMRSLFRCKTGEDSLNQFVQFVKCLVHFNTKPAVHR